MKILLINTNRNRYPVPVLPAGLCMVAEAAERKRHTVKLLDLLFERDPRAAAEAEIRRGYDLVGLSVRNIDNNDMQSPVCYINDVAALADAVRSACDVPIVLGGASLAVMPEQIMRATGVSQAVIGDGEVVFPELVDRLAHGMRYTDLPGIASLEDGIFRSNPPVRESPVGCGPVDYGRWLDLKRYCLHMATAPLQTKQGCQFHCVYCTYRKIEGAPYRLSDPAAVAETALRMAQSGMTEIEFVDNVFNAPYAHALSVCDELIRAKPHARFQSLELNPAFFDHELVVSMERAGFVGIGITAESASDRVLTGLRKGFGSREVHAAADAVRAHGIPCLWIFMLGGPGETHQTVSETLKFAEKVTRPNDAAFFGIGIRVYPGTELESIARNQGLLPHSADGMLAPVFYLSPDVDAARLIKQVKNSMNDHLNFMSTDSLGFRYLPLIQRLGYRLGVKSPLWRYTRHIRKGLRAIGMNV